MATWSPALDWRPIARPNASALDASPRFPTIGGTGFRVGGIQCTIQPSWWYLSAAIGVLSITLGVAGLGLDLAVALIVAFWTNAALLITTLAHEFGHVCSGARAGLEPRRVVLLWLGGMTAFAGQATGPQQKAISAIGGPVANVVLGLVLLGVGQLLGESPGRIVCLAFAAINGAFAASNLLPIPPQDGGIVLEAAIWARVKDPKRARILASRAGYALGAACAALGGLLSVSGGGWLAQALFVQGALTLVACVVSRVRQAPSPATVSGFRKY